LMAKADLALASFGMTAYELAAVGVPMLLLCLSEDHRVSAMSLATAGSAEIAGIAKDVSDTALDATIARLAADDVQREQLGRRARALIDGKGAARIAERLGARLSIHRDVENMAGLMAKADLALASFGMTAYELAAVGVPMLLLCLSEEHRVSATSLAEAGAAEVAGIAKDVTDAGLEEAIARLAADDARRERLGRRARALIDGKGAARIAERLAALASGPEKIAKAARASEPA
ncbi:MAG: hypothetical protein ACREFL_12905, partial [Stellaceae bacterium]